MMAFGAQNCWQNRVRVAALRLLLSIFGLLAISSLAVTGAAAQVLWEDYQGNAFIGADSTPGPSYANATGTSAQRISALRTIASNPSNAVRTGTSADINFTAASNTLCNTNVGSSVPCDLDVQGRVLYSLIILPASGTYTLSVAHDDDTDIDLSSSYSSTAYRTVAYDIPVSTLAEFTANDTTFETAGSIQSGGTNRCALIRIYWNNVGTINHLRLRWQRPDGTIEFVPSSALKDPSVAANSSVCTGPVTAPATSASLLVNKVIGANGRINPSDQFTVSISDATGTVLITSATTSGSGTGQQASTGAQAITTLTTYRITDAMAAGSVNPLSSYAATIACTRNGTAFTPTSVSTGVWSVTATATNQAVVCNVTNAAAAPTLRVQKITVGGAGGAFLFASSNTSANPAPISTTAANTVTPATPTPVNVSLTGTDVTITETAAAGFSQTSVSCTDTNSAATGNGATVATLTGTGAITIPGTAVRATASFNCVFTNTRQATLVLRKSWVNAVVNDQVTIPATSLFANNTTPLVSSAGTATEIDSGTSVTVLVGNSGTLPAETFNTGSQANYTSTLGCSGGTLSGTNALTANTLTINASDGGTTITCTYTNSRIPQQLNLAKNWVNAATGHTATATTTGAAAASFNSTAPSTGLTGAAVTVYAGDSITLPVETFGGGATAAMYTVTVACSGGTTLASGATGRSVTIGASTTATTCTYTNARVSSQLTLAKSWVNGRLNDAVDVQISRGGSAIDTLSAVSAGTATETDTDATPVTVFAGETLVLSESFTAPAGAGALYTASVNCSGAGSSLAGTTLTVGTGGTAITCTYQNSRIPQQLNLAKNWVNAATGHTATATTTGAAAASFNSTAPSTGLTGAAVTVYAGDSITLPVETFGGGATAAMYTVTVACSGGTTLASGATGRSVTIGASTTVTTCTYTNSRVAQQIRLAKAWQYSLSGHSINVTTTGGTANPSLASAAPTATTGSFVTVYAGDALALPVETFAGASASDYSTTVECSGGTALAAVAPPANIVVSTSTTDTTCTYRNTGKFVDLAITKTNTPGVNGNVDQPADTVTGGGTTTYQIRVVNNGPAPSSGARVIDTAVSQLSCPPANPVTCAPAAACTGTTDVAALTSASGITLGTLNVGQAVTLTFSCNVN